MSASVKTLYGPIPQSLLTKMLNIKLLVCDVDGVFSDGKIYMGNQGEELKTFHTLDGYGVKAIMKIGIEVAIVTGRKSNIVQNRMHALGVKHIIQGQEEKLSAVENLQKQLSISKLQTASVGDDMPDVGMFSASNIAFSVSNGHPYVKRKADYVTASQGGSGAVREICDLLLHAHGKLNDIYGSSV
jgi:3-deoxy-D-manno-octulosonate 8-phosphate phosphatase (KDO 8-P phosphatase)